MDSIPTRGCVPILNDFFKRAKEDGKSNNDEAAPKEVDGKVNGIVLDKITKSNQGSLLVAATAPHVVFGLIHDFALSPRKKRKKAIRKSTPILRKKEWAESKNMIPIGIQRCSECNWINALIQFIIYVPSLVRMFAFTPGSLMPFNDFIDQYLKDQSDAKSVTEAEVLSLRHCLHDKFPYKMDWVSEPCEILELLMRSVYENISYFNPDPSHFDLLALHPKWRMSFSCNANPESKTLEEAVALQIQDHFPPELLMDFQTNPNEKKGKKWSILNHYRPPFEPKRQLFFSQISNIPLCYELDSFIEYRPDGWNEGDYVTYIKVQGTWYQCDGTRITPLRSTNLQIPLKRSFLFHYKRLQIAQEAKIL